MKSLQTFFTRKNNIVFWTGLCVLTIAAAISSLWIGSVSLPPRDVFYVLIGRDTTSTAARIVLYTRLPRVCAALLAGAALSAAGAVIQRGSIIRSALPRRRYSVRTGVYVRALCRKNIYSF